MEKLSLVDYGMIGFITLIVFTAIYLGHKATKSWWLEMLSEKGELTEEEVQEMYMRSLTFGKCATGELFGALDRLKAELPEDQFNRILKHHMGFGEEIANMLLWHGEDKDEYWEARQAALEHYKAMKRIKDELSLAYVNPFPTPYWVG
jgi:hypothetical protein